MCKDGEKIWCIDCEYYETLGDFEWYCEASAKWEDGKCPSYEEREEE